MFNTSQEENKYLYTEKQFQNEGKFQMKLRVSYLGKVRD